MDIQLELEAPKTKEFLKYVLETLLNNRSLRDRKIIEVPLRKHDTPYPEFLENYPNRFQITDIQGELEKTEERHSTMAVVTAFYLRQLFKPFCTVLDIIADISDPTAFNIPIIIHEPAKFFTFATELKSSLLAKPHIIYFNNEGEFWNGSNDNKFCSFKENGKRLAVLCYLIDNKGFHELHKISSNLKDANSKLSHSEIGKIKSKVNKTLMTKTPQIIEGKKGSGYRINPKYKFIKKRN
jgi:hypothetical protein